MKWKYKYWIIGLLILASCSQKFDSHKWKEKNDPIDKERYYMVEDLIDSKVLVGKNKDQVKELLGDPVGMLDADSLNMYYNVWDYYGADIDPIKSYGLHIQFNDKGQVDQAEVQKWK